MPDALDAQAIEDTARQLLDTRIDAVRELAKAQVAVDVTVADVRVFLGHASVKTTSIYLASGEQRQEEIVQRRQRGRATLDDDREAA